MKSVSRTQSAICRVIKMSRLCIRCKIKFAEIPLCERCYDEINEEATPYANGLIKEFLEDLKKIKKECDIRENIIIGYESIKEKWEKKLTESSSGGDFRC